jgi:hypothetical protein
MADLGLAVVDAAAELVGGGEVGRGTATEGRGGGIEEGQRIIIVVVNVDGNSGGVDGGGVEGGRVKSTSEVALCPLLP